MAFHDHSRRALYPIWARHSRSASAAFVRIAVAIRDRLSRILDAIGTQLSRGIAATELGLIQVFQAARSASVAIARTVVAVRHRPARILDVIGAALSRFVAVTELGLIRVYRTARVATQASNTPVWEMGLIGATLVVSLVLLWLIFRTVQMVSRELVEFVVGVINSLLTRFGYPSL